MSHFMKIFLATKASLQHYSFPIEKKQKCEKQGLSYVTLRKRDSLYHAVFSLPCRLPPHLIKSYLTESRTNLKTL